VEKAKNKILMKITFNYVIIIIEEMKS
jgi:hypothetical protein